MKKYVYPILLFTVMLLAFTACDKKVAKVENASTNTEAPQSEAMPTEAIRETPNTLADTPTESPDETTIPEILYAPKETMLIVQQLIDLLKAHKFDEIQPLLTDAYDFDGDTLFNSENFLTYIDLTDFSIGGETFFGDYSSISIKVSRPDAIKIQSDFYDMMMDENTAYDGDINDYVKSVLASDSYPMTEHVCVLVVKLLDGEWKIDFDISLLQLISQTQTYPFAQSFAWVNAIDHEEGIAYIAENLIVTDENGYFSVINNGDKSVTSMSLKLEYIDQNGAVARTAYSTAFSGMNYGMDGSYEMKPGYMWSESKENLFYEYEKYNATPETSRVYVFDVQYEDNSPFPSLSAENQKFCDEFISIEKYEVEHDQSSSYWTGNGLTQLRIKNKSDKTITQLTIVVEFSDADGVIRSAKGYLIIGSDENSADTQIEPQGSWALNDEQFFPLYHVPELLVDQDNINIRIAELEYQ